MLLVEEDIYLHRFKVQLLLLDFDINKLMTAELIGLYDTVMPRTCSLRKELADVLVQDEVGKDSAEQKLLDK